MAMRESSMMPTQHSISIYIKSLHCLAMVIRPSLVTSWHHPNNEIDRNRKCYNDDDNHVHHNFNLLLINIIILITIIINIVVIIIIIVINIIIITTIINITINISLRHHYYHLPPRLHHHFHHFHQ